MYLKSETKVLERQISQSEVSGIQFGIQMSFRGFPDMKEARETQLCKKPFCPEELRCVRDHV